MKKSIKEIFQPLVDQHSVKLANVHFETTCPACGLSQDLSHCRTETEDDDVIYYCKNKCQPILITAYRDTTAYPDFGGYRLDDYIVRVCAPLYLKMPNSNPVLIPIGQRPHDPRFPRIMPDQD